MLFIVLTAVVITFLILYFSLRKSHRILVRELRDRIDDLEYDNQELQESSIDVHSQLIRERKALSDERGRNKSVEVRTGQIMEKLCMFMEEFKHDPKCYVPLGQPIDGIVFEEDYITIIEIKTGKSRLTPKQNKIKKLVEDGKVKFETVRFDYE